MALPNPSVSPDQWLRTADIIREYPISRTRLRQLIKQKAFRVYRPTGRSIFVKRSDMEAFFTSG